MDKTKLQLIGQAFSTLKDTITDIFGEENDSLEVVFADDSTATLDGKEIVVGAKVFHIVDEKQEPLADGEYEFKEGGKIVVKDGAIESFEEAEKFLETTLVGGGKVEISGDEVAVGASVWLVDEDGNREAAPDGTHELADGMSIVVTDGTIDEVIQGSEEPADMDDDFKAKTEKAIKELTDKVAGLEKEKDEFKAELKAEKEANEKIKKAVKETFAVVEALASEPGEGEPAKKKSRAEKFREERDKDTKNFKKRLDRIRELSGK
jgi:hypothetical protein